MLASKDMDKFQFMLPVGEATVPLVCPGKVGAISIHASRGGSDLLDFAHFLEELKFQSTLPVGEAT